MSEDTKTTIPIMKSTRDTTRKCGIKDDTWDDILFRLSSLYLRLKSKVPVWKETYKESEVLLEQGKKANLDTLKITAANQAIAALREVVETIEDAKLEVTEENHKQIRKRLASRYIGAAKEALEREM